MAAPGVVNEAPSRGLDRWGYSNQKFDQTTRTGLMQNQSLNVLGQLGNTVANDTTDQAIGVVAIPATAINTVSADITITNALITTLSHIQLTPKEGSSPSAATNRGIIVWVKSLSNGSAIILVMSPLVLIATNNWIVQYQIWTQG